ncbi:nicotinate (nicotinamide) nucleotide adenylyltransferase [Candidatus Roizmanbacteria bacterium]|nr:nicotinate (nicotinamide) nucleotide adenylyltransferase [Candidatus Roizmanbacteria bacterium]
MKIAILGGAFDPPHIGHYLVASQVKENLKMDEVWLMTCYSYFPEFPIKFAKITPYEERHKMASYFKKIGIQVSDFEGQYNKRSRTIDTLRLLYKKYPQHSFSWIIGSDCLPSFHLWNEWRELVQKHNLIIFPRDTDFKTLENRVREAFKLRRIPPNITIVEGDLMVSNIASTHIRNRVRRNLPITSFVLPEVESYIKKNRLYI